MKTFWLSFCNRDRPKGSQFLGVSVVDVTDDDVEAIRTAVLARAPHADNDALWTAAAVRKAHQSGCNPGGEVALMEMPDEWPDAARCPRHELLSAARLKELGL